MPRDDGGLGRLVQVRRHDLDREGRNRLAANLRRHGHDQAGIDAAAEVGDHRHVGPQPAFHGAQHHLLELIDESSWHRCRSLRGPDRGNRSASSICARRGRAGRPSGKLDASGNGPAAAIVMPAKAGGRAGHGEEVEDLIDAAQVGLRVNPAGGQEGLDLGGEQQPIAAVASLRRVQ